MGLKRGEGIGGDDGLDELLAGQCGCLLQSAARQAARGRKTVGSCLGISDGESRHCGAIARRKRAGGGSWFDGWGLPPDGHVDGCEAPQKQLPMFQLISTFHMASCLVADLGGLDELFDKEETLQANARAPGGKIKKAAAQHEEQPWRQAEISDSEGEEEGAPSEEEEEGSGSEGLSEDDDLGEIGLLESGEDEEAEEGLDEEEQEDLGQEEEEKVWEKQQGGEERQQGDSEGSEQLSGSGSDGQLSDLDVLGSGASSGEEDGQEDGEEEEDKEAGTGSEDASGSGSDREPARQRQRPAPAEAANPTERYVPPAARRAAAAAAAASAGAAQGEEERVARRVRGLLNRIAESNLQGIVGQLAELFQVGGQATGQARCGR